MLPTDETYERRGSYVVSSIGSIPERLSGVEMKGELYAFNDWDLGRLPGYPTLFSAGNVVTGKGNIVASRKHAASIGEHMAERFLGLIDGHEGEEALLDGLSESARQQADAVADQIAAQPELERPALETLLARVAERQEAVGYDGDYRAWLERVTPPDLE